jgi:predicted methyltransferase
MMTIAGDLYSAAFYRELYRVLRRGGRMFHYIGDPDSPSGKRTTGGVIRRLQDAGFSRVVRRPEAFGVVAYK